MQVFRELYIRGEPEQLAATADAITASLSGDWVRASDDEERMRLAPVGDRKVYCFRCRKRDGRPAATLFLTERGGDSYWVSNILPDQTHELSHEEYNGIAREFFERFVLPAVARTGAKAELTEPESDLERWLSPETARKLRDFCNLAGKWSGASHPADRNRWNDFVLAAHREGADFPASTLAHWLQEDGGWSGEWAFKLAVEYEQARSLLAQADSQTVGI